MSSPSALAARRRRSGAGRPRESCKPSVCPHTHNQIIVRSDNYTTFQLGGRAWIKIPGLTKGQRIAIPLNSTVAPTGTLRLILKDDDRLEVHTTIDAEITQDCGERTIGIDKGYSEVLVDSDGEHHGPELGGLLTDTSDKLKAKYQRRSLVNPAYTSQIDSRNGCLLGKRQGDRFHCVDGEVLQADQNAARNVLARLTDPEIERFTPYRQVKAILQARTERLRLRLPNPDSSCSPGSNRALSTESERPKNCMNNFV